MFGIGPAEILVVAVVALVFVGPQRLPEMMRQFGKILVKTRRATADVRESFDETIRQAERDLVLEEAAAAKAQAASEPSGRSASEDANIPSQKNSVGGAGIDKSAQPAGEAATEDKDTASEAWSQGVATQKVVAARKEAQPSWELSDDFYMSSPPRTTEGKHHVPTSP
jgi:sec-independent protein translocase protein TatB